MGDQGLFVVPLAVTLFVFILLCNWLELIPTTWPGHHQIIPAPTGDINMTAALAVLVIVLVHFTCDPSVNNGFRAYIAHYFKPYKGLFLINVVEEIAKPLTLALRLFGNIFAGGLMLRAVRRADVGEAHLAHPHPRRGRKRFDGVFVGPVQAFIFTLLTILYFQIGCAPEEH